MGADMDLQLRGLMNLSAANAPNSYHHGAAGLMLAAPPHLLDSAQGRCYIDRQACAVAVQTDLWLLPVRWAP